MSGWSETDNKANLSQAELNCCWNWAGLSLAINAKAAALESNQQSCYNEGIPQVDGQIDPIFKCDRCDDTFEDIEISVKHVLCHVFKENGTTNEKILAL